MPHIDTIRDPDDPRIAAFRQVRDRDVAGRGGGFIAEGEVVLRAAVRAGRHALDAVLLADKRVAGLGALLAELPPTCLVYRAEQPVMDAIAGFHIHRGILAAGRRATAPPAAELLAGLEGDAVVVALMGIGNHDNMGGIFRNAAAFGAAAVLLAPDCCDPLYRKAIRVSVGAALTAPFARLAAGEDMVALLESAGFETLALTPAAGRRLADAPRPPRAAVLLGAEGPGLPPEILARTHPVGIPMAGRFDSLNVATTCGIALHHLAFSAEPRR